LLPDREWLEQVIRAPSLSHIQTEDPMRMTIATVLAIGVTVLISLPALAATLQSQSPQPAATAPAKPAINLNTATLEQLETLPGIGRKTAERILEYRTKSGSFKRIEDLMNVKGIGEKSFLKLKPLVIVPPAKTDKAPGD
jgi:competence protein ComEA